MTSTQLIEIVTVFLLGILFGRVLRPPDIDREPYRPFYGSHRDQVIANSVTYIKSIDGEYVPKNVGLSIQTRDPSGFWTIAAYISDETYRIARTEEGK